MESLKILEVTEKYQSHFENQDIGKKRFPPNKKLGSSIEILSHCHWMLGEIQRFIIEERIGKALRWLGFVQGCLWSVGQFSLEELREHNRSE